MSDAVSPDVTVAVIGAGTMGNGIAHVAARAGHPVVLFDVSTEAVERGRSAIAKDLGFLVSKQRLGQAEADAILGRVRTATTLEAVGGAGLVVEAIVEDREAKRRLFAELESRLPDTAIIASNTSSFSITELAAGLGHPERVVGMHFFNPAPRMALVEVVDGLQTDPKVAESILATSRAWGKTPVRARSTPGFIVNRVARPYYGEAMRTLTEQACTPATLDAVLRDCGGFAMGPCELMDLIGLDVNLAVTGSVFSALGWDRRYAPSLIQQELVRGGRLGRKSGRGFHDYGPGASAPVADVEPPRGQGAAPVSASAERGLLQPLVARLAAGGINVQPLMDAHAHCLHVGAARVSLSDGRTATRIAAEIGEPNVVLVDLAFDFSRTTRLTLARADPCSAEAYDQVVATFQSAGFTVTGVDDIAGMVVLRTVATLVNEAADVVTQGIATAADVDTAMRLGTNYPQGPLGWADRLTPAFVATVLDHLRAHYGEERYRVSPALQRRRYSEGAFHG
ncbi:MAG: 3-hydroxyacyl-CoA dehydrogenase PaaH [Burkholderiales bacterium]